MYNRIKHKEVNALDIAKLNSIIMKSQGVQFVVDIDGKHSVDDYVKNDNFFSMMTYVANCLSNIVSQGYIAPFDIYKKAEQSTGYDVEIASRSDFNSYPVNLVVTPGMYVPIGAYINEKMGVINGNEVDFTNLSTLFRDLVTSVEPGQLIPTSPFMLMIISSRCPEFMKGMFPVYSPTVYPPTPAPVEVLEDENEFVEDLTSVDADNPFLSDLNSNYDNSDVLGL